MDEATKLFNEFAREVYDWKDDNAHETYSVEAEHITKFIEWFGVEFFQKKTCENCQEYNKGGYSCPKHTEDELRKQLQVEVNLAAIRKAATLIAFTAFDTLYSDAHQWSTRSCQTCAAITGLMGFDVGCVRYAKEKRSVR